MYRSTVFIISKRKELSIKYKKLLEGLNQEVYILTSLSETFKQLPLKEPELIIISDTIEEDLSEFCKKIRVLTFNFRPCIIAVSKSSEMMDKLKTLESGADDFLSESISSGEFQARAKAHLRRYVENSLNPITFFVQNNLTTKAIKRTVTSPKNTAIMLIDVHGLNLYREIYSEIAYEKVLQTVGSIINSTLSNEDFIGQGIGNEFILITSVEKAEKVASFLTFAFDNVLERFYSEFDFKNKFMQYSADDKIENKTPLMKLCIAALEVSKNRFKDHKEVLNALYIILNMCKKAKQSSYYFDRPKLRGEKSEKENNKILITENDEALFYLLKTTCEMQNYKVRGLEKGEDFTKIFKIFQPNIVIVDWGMENSKEGLEICKKIKALKGNSTKIIFSSSIYKKKEILSAGADLYLPKPYDINVMLSWINKLLEE